MKLIDPERLAFLSGVVSKEVALLLQSMHELQSVFDGNTDAVIALNLFNSPTPNKLADQLELFAGRFSRLQDTVGDKLLEQLMRSLGEPPLAQLAKLDRAEALGWLLSADVWQETRQLRNLLVHEYIADTMLLVASLRTALTRCALLLDTAERLTAQVSKLIAKASKLTAPSRSNEQAKPDVGSH